MILADRKIVRNFVSAFHAITTCALYSSRHHQPWMIYNSLAYFAWDILYILAQERWECGYLFHHALAIFLLAINDTYGTEIILYVLFTSEFSNLPTYYVYHQLKLGNDSLMMRVGQFIWFSYFRLYKYTELMLLYMLMTQKMISYAFVALYVFSFVVWYRQIKKISTFFE